MEARPDAARPLPDAEVPGLAGGNGPQLEPIHIHVIQ